VSKPQEFRRYAEQCKRLVEDGDVAAHRDALHSMAHAWLQLAAEEERISDFVREVDNLFSAPGGALNAVRLCSREINPLSRSH
jgi:hypothetical protein